VWPFVVNSSLMTRYLRTFLLFSFLLATSLLQAQTSVTERSSFKDRLYFGGGLDVSFGSNITVLGVSPLLGYMITSKLSSGIGVIYQYYKDNNFDFSTNIYGGRIFSRYNIFNPFLLYNEYEVISFERSVLSDEGREAVSAYYVGGGISQPLGRNAAITLIVLYDLLHDDFESAQPNPISVRGGVTVGF